MFRNVLLIIITMIVVTSLLLSACGAEDAQVPAIETAVALTIAAQNSTPSPTNTEESGLAFPTKTPVQFAPTLTPLVPDVVSSPTLEGAVTARTTDCGKAEFVSQSIPDATIFRPGETFTQTWEIKNVSGCVWDSRYKIVLWDGDVMGGAYVYNMPQSVPPQTVVPISLLLTAPAADGTYISEWKIQAPDNTKFGLGEYSVPFTFEMAVSSAKRPGYAVTNIEINVVREPATGCPANVWYYAYATVTTNGPLEFDYRWEQKDNNNSKFFTTEVKAAGSIVLTRSWSIHLSSTPGEKWFSMIAEFDGGDYYSPRAYFTYDCGAY